MADETVRARPAEEIVVGTDGSEGARAATDWAVAEGTRTGRPVRVVRVWDPAPQFAPPGPVYAVRSTIRADEQQQLDADLARLAAKGTTVPGELLEGAVAQRLVRIAANAAMLVVGSHGHGALGRALLGSVSTECARHATCPVVVIPLGAAHRIAAGDGVETRAADPAAER